MTELIKDRIELLLMMHDYIIEMGDEDIYMYWAQEGVPDCPDDEIIEFIATHDENWVATCKAFAHCINNLEEEG